MREKKKPDDLRVEVLIYYMERIQRTYDKRPLSVEQSKTADLFPLSVSTTSEDLSSD